MCGYTSFPEDGRTRIRLLASHARDEVFTPADLGGTVLRFTKSSENVAK